MGCIQTSEKSSNVSTSNDGNKYELTAETETNQTSPNDRNTLNSDHNYDKKQTFYMQEFTELFTICYPVLLSYLGCIDINNLILASLIDFDSIHLSKKFVFELFMSDIRYRIDQCSALWQEMHSNINKKSGQRLDVSVLNINQYPEDIDNDINKMKDYLISAFELYQREICKSDLYDNGIDSFEPVIDANYYNTKNEPKTFDISIPKYLIKQDQNKNEQYDTKRDIEENENKEIRVMIHYNENITEWMESEESLTYTINIVSCTELSFDTMCENEKNVYCIKSDDYKNENKLIKQYKDIEYILNLLLTPYLMKYKLFVVCNAERIESHDDTEIDDGSIGSSWGSTSYRQQILIFAVYDINTVVVLQIGLD